jgi:hypothetical protein
VRTTRSAQRVVAGEQPDLRRARATAHEHRTAEAVEAVARGQPTEDGILVSGDDEADAATARREERQATAVAEHEAVDVDDRRLARGSGTGGQGPLLRERAARARVDAHVTGRGHVRREGDHAEVVDGGRADVHEGRGASGDLDRSALVQAHDRRRQIQVRDPHRHLAGGVHRDGGRDVQVGRRAELIGARQHEDGAVGVATQNDALGRQRVVDRDRAGVVDHDRGGVADTEGVAEVQEWDELRALAPEKHVGVLARRRIGGECREGHHTRVVH